MIDFIFKFINSLAQQNTKKNGVKFQSIQDIIPKTIFDYRKNQFGLQRFYLKKTPFHLF